MSQANGLLVWSDPKDWNAAVHRFLEDCVPQDIRSKIVRNPEMYFFNDGTTWPDDQPVPLLPNNQKIPGARELLEAFQQTYPRIRMFHGCRTDDVSSYLRDGLRVLNVDKQIEKARNIFITDQFPQITEEHIMAAARELNNQGRQNSLCFVLDDSNLINHTPHYLRSGSEYLTVMALDLSHTTGLDCIGLLRSIGMPTVFICDVPLSMVQIHTVFNLLVELLRWTIYYPYQCNQDKPTTGFGFTFHSPIPARFITSYYHPEEKCN